ncbi:MAG TPA: 2-hydroxyacyl-CoA dehydratase [Firmicutes bacterium]|nr:2-hydroxyacyl-CoA dehydratase [Bacillota bacterium]
MDLVGWICTYTPEEIIRAAGFLPYRLLPYNPEDSAGDRDLLPPALCPYVRQAARSICRRSNENLRGLVIANSCSAAIHLYNTFAGRDELFVHLLDLPRLQTAEAVEFFTAQLTKMAFVLGREGQEVTLDRLRQAVEYCRETEKLYSGHRENSLVFQGEGLSQFFELVLEGSSGRRYEFNLNIERLSKRTGVTPPYLVLTGALPPRGLVELLAESNLPCHLDNCLASRYIFRCYPPGLDKASTREELLQVIAGSYLDKPPCPRVNSRLRQESYRRQFTAGKVRGVIYHDLSFCDLSHYDSLILAEECASFNIPLLKINTELGLTDAGQIQTRIQAFLEMLG